MPVITFKYQDLKDLGINIKKDELIDTLPMMSSDIEDFDDEEIKVEFFPNRPDNLSVEGVARSFKGFIGQEIGLPNYEVTPSGEFVVVDEQVAKIRPYIAFAKIEGVDFKGDKLKYIMDFQENLHWVIGRDRKKVAIGIHNADVVNAPYKYIATAKDENEFIPLEKSSTMTPYEILTKHEKGVDYAHLIEDFDNINNKSLYLVIAVEMFTWNLFFTGQKGVCAAKVDDPAGAVTPLHIPADDFACSVFVFFVDNLLFRVTHPLNNNLFGRLGGNSAQVFDLKLETNLVFKRDTRIMLSGIFQRNFCLFVFNFFNNNFGLIDFNPSLIFIKVNFNVESVSEFFADRGTYCFFQGFYECCAINASVFADLVYGFFQFHVQAHGAPPLFYVFGKTKG